MVVYSFYIFDRHTECIYSKLWHRNNSERPLSTTASSSARPLTSSSAMSAVPPALNAPPDLGPARPRGKLSAQDDAKLIFGTIFSLRNMVRKLGVVKNPLSPVEHPGGEGVANELFELALDQFVKGVL
ncbi:Sybindin-like family protein [Rutstroemia sp. NJR-2017a BBW]|nr:Sybindin-like family protein [Rutstroemia sp. NJR-2017a BBW]